MTLRLTGSLPRRVVSRITGSVLRRGGSTVQCHDSAVPRFTTTTGRFPFSLPRRGSSQVHYHYVAVPRSLPRRGGSRFTATTRRVPGSLLRRGGSAYHCPEEVVPLFTYPTGLFHGLLPRRGCSSDQGYDAPFPLVHSQDVAVPRFTPTTRLFPG